MTVTPYRSTVGGARDGFDRLLLAEWTKLRTLRSTAWLLAALAVLTVVAGAAVTGAVDTSHCPTAGCQEDTPKLALSGVRLGQVAAVVLGVLAVGGEYSTGTITVTIAAVPRRLTVLLAKAAVVAAAVAAGGTAGVLGSLAAGRAILPGNGFSAAGGPVARAALGTVLYLILVTLLSLGVAAAVRDTAGAITAVFTLLWTAPVLTRIFSDPTWQERLDRLAPMPAGLAVQSTRNLDRLPIGPWAGLGVLAAYTASALLLGGTLLATRDA